MAASQHRWIAGFCVAAAVLAGGAAAQAEPTSVEMRALNNRLEKLERDLIDVQRQTYQAGSAAGSVSAGAGFGPDPASAADLSLRLQSVEDSLRSLTGRIEKLSFDLNQTRSRFRQFAEDVEFRFQELGSSGGRSLVADDAPSSGPDTFDGGATSSGAAATIGSLGSIPAGALPPGGDNSGGDNGGQPMSGSGAGSQLASYPPAGGVSGQTAPEDAYEAAINQLKRGQFDTAEADLANFLQRYPDHNLAGNAQYWLGETFYVRGAYRQAAEAFLTGYTTYASSSKAPDSLLKLGMTLAALGQRDQACATLGELNRRFPSASQAVTQRAQLERRRAGC